MEIRIVDFSTGGGKAAGLTVVIDVLRAFTTACYVLGNGAERILSVADLDDAYALKKNNPAYILMGERLGIKQKGFDYGNSPAEIQHVSFADKTVILTTTAGTRGLAHAMTADEVITGSFVNAGAVAAYIKRKNPKRVTFFCTDDWHSENEDVMCAKYIESVLTGKPMNFSEIRNYMQSHPSADGFLLHPVTQWGPRDFAMCLTLDVFPFVIRAEKGNPIALHTSNV